MSYHQQLRSVFSDQELEVLQYLLNHESSTDTMSDVVHNMSAVEKRALVSIRDKLAGAQTIRNSKTTPPSKL